MKKLLFFLLFTFSINFANQVNYKLITVLYNETNDQRIAEYIYCFEKNLMNKFISEIHVIYDTSKDDSTNNILNYLLTKNIKISYLKKRPTFDFCFELANWLYKNSRVIIANADIFFDNSLGLIKHNFNFNKKIIALTRYNIQKDGLAEFHKYSRSQDAWILKTPIKKFYKNIEFGQAGCDNALVYYARNLGLNVINPCKTIKIFHYHLSKIHNYKISQRTFYPKCDINKISVAFTTL